MSNAKDLIATYGTLQWLIDKQTDGLSHADSVIQPQPRGNCLNWVLGHVLSSRNRALLALGAAPVRTDDVNQWYATGSDPITGADQGVPLPDLLAALREARERLTAALNSGADLDAIYDEENQRSVGDRVAGLQWHETYHVGQLELLRQLAGTDDAVV